MEFAKGVAYILIALIIVLTIVPLVYIVGGYVVSQVYRAVNTSEIVTPHSRSVLDYILMIWDYWPVLAVVIGILWAILVAQKHEPWWESE